MSTYVADKGCNPILQAMSAPGYWVSRKFKWAIVSLFTGARVYQKLWCQTATRALSIHVQRMHLAVLLWQWRGKINTTHAPSSLMELWLIVPEAPQCHTFEVGWITIALFTRLCCLILRGMTEALCLLDFHVSADGISDGKGVIIFCLSLLYKEVTICQLLVKNAKLPPIAALHCQF